MRRRVRGQHPTRLVDDEADLLAPDEADAFEPHVVDWPIGGIMMEEDGCEPDTHVWGPSYVLPDVVTEDSDRRAAYAGCTKCAAMIRLEPAPLDMHDRDAIERWLDS